MEKTQASIKQFVIRELTAEEAMLVVGAGRIHAKSNPNLQPQPTTTSSSTKK